MDIVRRNLIKNICLSSVIFSPLLTSCAQIVNLLARQMLKVETSKDVEPIKPIKNNIRSNLAIVTDKSSVDENGKINYQSIEHMVNEGIKALTGKSNSEDGWLEIIPKLEPDTKIGIKINCINSPLATHPELIKALIKSLNRIGVNENNIIVWDKDEWNPSLGGMIRSGFKINNTNEGVRQIATNTKGIGYDDKNLIYIPSLQIRLPITKIISQMCDYLINVSVLKDHRRAGIAGCMKNFYGAIPLLYFDISSKITKLMHVNNCNPQIAELYNNPIIKNRIILHINDALLGIYYGGPLGSPQWINNQIIMSKDPVAVDYISLLLIEKKRKEKNLPSMLKHAKYIQTAAEMGLGTNNPEQMEIREIKLS